VRKRSCPAVSQICNLMVLPSSSIVPVAPDVCVSKPQTTTQRITTQTSKLDVGRGNLRILKSTPIVLMYDSVYVSSYKYSQKNEPCSSHGGHWREAAQHGAKQPRRHSATPRQHTKTSTSERAKTNAHTRGEQAHTHRGRRRTSPQGIASSKRGQHQTIETKTQNTQSHTANRSSRQLLPTPESPISSSLNR
jgi:hypothetical protein